MSNESRSGLVAVVALMSFTAFLASATVAFAAPTPTAIPATTAHPVSSRGWTARVPTGWSVIDLAADPSACVRFDVHAIYLGRPGGQESCPSHVSGHSEALLVEPIEDLTASADLTSATVAVRSLPGSASSSSQVRVAVPTAGVLLTATWGTDRSTVEHLLATATATPGWQAASPKSSGFAAPPPRTNAQTRARTSALSSGQFTGQAFDACTAPSLATMSAWLSSPYRAVGIYIGGANRACSQHNLTAGWVNTVTAQGWHLIPIYVGRQAPFPSCGCLPIDPSLAAAEGRSAAVDAVADARWVGIGRGAALFNDMEGYTRGATNTGAVLTFLSAWTAKLHELGYRSGVYSGSTSGIRDLVAVAPTLGGLTPPDVLWYAYWDGRAQVTNALYLPADQWTHERMHQYSSSSARWGGVTINIDRSAVDAHLIGSIVDPPPPTPRPPPQVVSAASARSFVGRAYSVTLGRRPTTSEADFWTWCVSFGSSRGAFLNGLVSSRDWARRMMTTEYLIVLRRTADPAGATYWTNWLMSGGQPDVLAATLAGSTERWRSSGSTAAGFVRGLYRDILTRSPAFRESVYWNQRLRSGISRATVARLFTTGQEQTSRFVTAAFRGLLGRSPDTRGLAYWSSVYRKHLDPASVLVPLGASAEAINR